MRHRGSYFNLAAVCVAVLLILAALGAPASATKFETLARWDKQIQPGILYSHFKMTVDGLPLHVYLLTVSLERDEIKIKPMLANNRLDSLETVTSMSRRTGAVAAINGSYFNRSSSDPFPVGFIMIDGRTLYFSHLHRSAFGLTENKIPLFGYPRTQGIVYIEKTGEYFYLWGINRRRRDNEALVYTPEFGLRTGTNDSGREVRVSGSQVVEMRNGDSEIPPDGFVVSLHGDSRKFFDKFSVGDRAWLFFLVESSWLKVNNALTGGPLLLRGGKCVLDKSVDEKLRQGSSARIPVTAVANTLDGRLLLLVADGRQKNYSVGMTYTELTTLMKNFGAVNAIGMDGGGSSTMVINGEVMNRPSDGASRPVSNGIGVYLYGQGK